MANIIDEPNRELRRLDRAHDCGCTLAGAEGSGEEPFIAG